MSLVVALTAVAIVALLVPAPAGAAGSAPVTVTNTPLPVQLQGTGNIAGTVLAAQSGQWSVDVASLPAVQLTAGTTLATSDVESSNESSIIKVRIYADGGVPGGLAIGGDGNEVSRQRCPAG
jgi:hypothetical protein